MSKRAGLALFFVLGLVLRASPALDIFHELGHWASGYFNMIPTRITAWDYTATERLTPSFVYAGYWGEALGYWFAGMFMLTRKRWELGGIFVGIMIPMYFSGLTSSDFNSLAPRVVGIPMAEDAITFWTFFVAVQILVLCVLYILMMRRNKHATVLCHREVR